MPLSIPPLPSLGLCLRLLSTQLLPGFVPLLLGFPPLLQRRIAVYSLKYFNQCHQMPGACTNKCTD